MNLSCYWMVSVDLFWPSWNYFDDCCWITVSWESSGFGLNTRGWNSQEKPSIHLFHIPQVTFPHKCKCKDVAVMLMQCAFLHTNAELCNANLFFTQSGSENWLGWHPMQNIQSCHANVIIFSVTGVQWNASDWWFVLSPGFYEGMLWKKGKAKTQFLERKFVLFEREFTLSYYTKGNVSSLHLWPFNCTGQHE